MSLPRVSPGDPQRAADFNALSRAVDQIAGDGIRHSGGGVEIRPQPEQDRRLMRCVVSDRTGLDIDQAGNVNYTLDLLETGVSIGPVSFDQRVISGVYDATHMIRSAPVGSPGLVLRYSDANGQPANRYWIFDEHAARVPCPGG